MIIKKMAIFKLHLLGYDCVPKGIGGLFRSIKGELGELDMRYL